MARCEDCTRCTETSTASTLRAFPRVLRSIFWGLWAGFLRRKCSHCGHLMIHHHIIDERFRG